MEITINGTMEEIDEFCKRWTGTLEKPALTIKNNISKMANVKKPSKKTTTAPKSKFVDFPPSMQKRYDLRWAMSKRNEDWWTLRYKNGQGYKKFELNLLQLCFLKTFNGKIQEKELDKYAKKFDMSPNKIRKIIWNLKVGAFNKYFVDVEKQIKKIKVNVLRNNTLLINNVECEMTAIEAKGLLFSIQNAPNKAREMLKQYRQFEHKIGLKEYFLLCWNYDNSDVLETIRFGGV